MLGIYGTSCTPVVVMPRLQRIQRGSSLICIFIQWSYLRWYLTSSIPSYAQSTRITSTDVRYLKPPVESASDTYYDSSSRRLSRKHGFPSQARLTSARVCPRDQTRGKSCTFGRSSGSGWFRDTRYFLRLVWGSLRGDRLPALVRGDVRGLLPFRGR